MGSNLNSNTFPFPSAEVPILAVLPRYQLSLSFATGGIIHVREYRLEQLVVRIHGLLNRRIDLWCSLTLRLSNDYPPCDCQGGNSWRRRAGLVCDLFDLPLRERFAGETVESGKEAGYPLKDTSRFDVARTDMRIS
jgi:hypothetical protein